MLVYRILSLFFVLGGTRALKILGIFPVVSRSHYNVAYSLLRELASRGHDVTMVTPFEAEEEVGNLTRIVLSGLVEEWELLLKANNPVNLQSRSAIMTIFFLEYMGLKITEQTLSHEKVQRLVKSNQKFDIVFCAHHIFDGIMSIASHFDAPLVLVSTTGPSIWSNHLFGNPDIPSYMGSIIMEPPVHTYFWKRVYNFLIYISHKTFLHYYVYPQQNAIVQKYLPSSTHIRDYMFNASLIIFNSHPALSQVVPLLPNMLEIGGFHVKPPQKLPEDLHRILDEAKNGVIYFSMGSLMQTKEFSLTLREEILRALSKLKETVLWKFEDDLPNRPENVIVRKWFPQSDILAHPNVKLFITHGGLLSTIESLHRGVPVVGIPVFTDQIINVANAVKRGQGRMIPFAKLSEVTLSRAVEEVLGNPKYSVNAKYSSKIFRDQHTDPVDKVEYWIEYVVRHKGARHLRSDALELAWYQQASLDVVVFLTAVTVLLFVVFYEIVRRLLGRKNVGKVKTN